MPRISFPTYIRLVDCCREDALMSVLSNPKDSTKSLIYYLRLGLGLYSSWGSIVLISVFDWACISFSKGWGSIQEWASICADTVSIAFRKE